MKRYYFLQSVKDSNGELRVRALTDQFLEDGTPIYTDLNVHTPKEAKDYKGGARNEYPEGTLFCSDHLERCSFKNTGTPFYSVYVNNDDKTTPNFHPISADPNFKYLKPSHKDDDMNTAYVMYTVMGTNELEDVGEEDSSDDAKGAVKAYYSPADENGLARPEDPAWKERYDGQLEAEAQLFINWMNSIFKDKNLKLKIRLTMGATAATFEKLHRMGETIDSMASTPRFEAFLAAEKTCYEDFSIITDIKYSPLKAYLTWIEKEHDGRKECSAVERNATNPKELSDAITIVGFAVSNMTSVMDSPNAADKDRIMKALQAGFTLDDLIDPDNIRQATDIRDYTNKLTDGTIKLPERLAASGASYIDMLLADKKNALPKDKDGFHVDERTWKILLENLYRRRNTMLIGPSGSGKTEVIKLLCDRTGTPYTIIQMGSITDPTEQLIGKMDIDSLTGGTVFDYAEFALAIQRPGVIILDEINRIPKNGENTIYGCLDRTRELPAAGAKSSDCRTIKVHPDCCFFATANIGAQFTGTKEIDEALNTRFLKVEMDYMSISDEQKILMSRTGVGREEAKNIAFVAHNVREMAAKGDIQTSISTRETLTCAELVADGFSQLEAMELVFLPLYDAGCGHSDPTSERMQIKNVISQRFKNKKDAA